MKDVAGNAERAVGVEWDEFEEFLRFVGKRGGFRIIVSDSAKDDIKTRAEEEFRKLMLAEDGGEPPFIPMLRRLLLLMYQGKWVTVEWRTRRG